MFSHGEFIKVLYSPDKVLSKSKKKLEHLVSFRLGTYLHQALRITQPTPTQATYLPELF